MNDDNSLQKRSEEASLEMPSDIGKLEEAERSLIDELRTGKDGKYDRLILALLGSLPWVGFILSASASFSAEIDQDKINGLQFLWIKEHQEKIKALGITIQDIISRLDNFGNEINERIQSPEYLSLVRRTFRSWDQSETNDKRQMLKKLITNAAATTLCPDDLIRLFIAWIDQYHEAHFLVIKEIYQNPQITRAQIWSQIHGDRPREDSSEADLFRYLIRELSMGGVIRQEREVNMYGQFVRKTSGGRGSGEGIMESAFEETKPYVLTELGKQFVHYVMEDVVPQLSEEKKNASGE